MIKSAAVALGFLLISFNAGAADIPREPMTVLNALADRMYALGETSGKASDMIAAEEKAAEEVRLYIASGATEGLLEKAKVQQSPLLAAAYMGYPNVVAALLASGLVRSHINDAGEMGLTPWIAANLSMKQSLWTCNPAVFDNPFKFVPMVVTQPYYLLNPAAPYMKTRELLEKAGAQADVAKAKEAWIANCKNQSPDAEAKVRASTDLLKTLSELSAADLNAQLLKLQQRANGPRQ